MLIKVLRDGRSFHGGDFEWSLPKGGSPGEWHECAEEPVLCCSGFHLTDWAAAWWDKDAKAYLVEAEGIVGELSNTPERKVTCKRVRLVRELTEDELNAAGVFRSGSHFVSDAKVYAASGSATVQASGSATVQAWGSATVRAWDSATVQASGSATVRAWDSATVNSYGTNVNVTVTERAVHIARGDGYSVPVVTVGGAA